MTVPLVGRSVSQIGTPVNFSLPFKSLPDSSPWSPNATANHGLSSCSTLDPQTFADDLPTEITLDIARPICYSIYTIHREVPLSPYSVGPSHAGRGSTSEYGHSARKSNQRRR